MIDTRVGIPKRDQDQVEPKISFKGSMNGCKYELKLSLIPFYEYGRCVLCAKNFSNVHQEMNLT